MQEAGRLLQMTRNVHPLNEGVCVRGHWPRPDAVSSAQRTGVGLGPWCRRLTTALPFLLMCVLLLTGHAADRMRLRTAAEAAGGRAPQSLEFLMSEALPVGAQADDLALRRVNDFYNRRIEFSTDAEVWGVQDFWSSPMELLARGQGDCEDFAIAKYFTLIAAGVAPARLRMVYVRASTPRGVQAHMVLAYYPQPSAEPLVLDNLVTDILPASARTDLQPVFSFNADGLWQGVGRASAGDPQARLSRWRRVIQKARSEGWW